MIHFSMTNWINIFINIRHFQRERTFGCTSCHFDDKFSRSHLVKIVQVYFLFRVIANLYMCWFAETSVFVWAFKVALSVHTSVVFSQWLIEMDADPKAFLESCLAQVLHRTPSGTVAGSLGFAPENNPNLHAKRKNRNLLSELLTQK